MSSVALPRDRRDHRRRASKRIEGDLAEAERLKEQSDAAHRGLREGAGRRPRPRPGARQRDPRQAHAEADERRKALEAQLNAKLAEAEKTIAATKTAAMANVQRHRGRRRRGDRRAADRHGAGRQRGRRPPSPTR